MFDKTGKDFIFHIFHTFAIVIPLQLHCCYFLFLIVHCTYNDRWYYIRSTL